MNLNPTAYMLQIVSTLSADQRAAVAAGDWKNVTSPHLVMVDRWHYKTNGPRFTPTTAGKSAQKHLMAA